VTSPFALTILLEECRLTRYDQHTERRLSSLRGQYSDSAAYQRLLESGDPIIYEVYESLAAGVAGELRTGSPVVHPAVWAASISWTRGTSLRQSTRRKPTTGVKGTECSS